jgi:hypothetical protein
MVFKETIRTMYRWLNRRSERKSYNWKTFKQMLSHYRISGVTNSMADVFRQDKIVSGLTCERVCLKSPVRENRTSGSVAGYGSNLISCADGKISGWAFFKDRNPAPEEKDRKKKCLKRKIQREGGGCNERIHMNEGS